MSELWSRFEVADGWHRVHWFRLAELLAQAAVASFMLLSTGIPNGIGAWVEELFGLVMGLFAITNYLSTRYRITDSRVTTTKGVLFRSEETMRRADVQTVEVVHPIWYRPFNLARVTVADDAGNELAIGPVKTLVAEDFAAALQPADVATRGLSGERVADDVSAASPTTAAPSDRPAEESLALRVTIPLWQRFLVSVFDLGLVITLIPVAATGYFGSWVVAALVGVAAMWVPIFEVIAMGRFRLSVAGDEILVRDGIMTVSESRTTRHRSEYLRIDTPLMYRLLRLERVQLGNGDNVLTVSPAQRRGDWRGLAAPLLGVAAPDDSTITPISSRSVGRFQLIGAVVAVTVGALASFIDWRVAIALAVGIVVALVFWYPRARLARFGLGSTGTAVITRASFAPRRTWLHRLDRIDSSVITTTPGQRRRALATLRFSGRSNGSEVRIPDLDVEFAATCEHFISTRRPGVPDPATARPVPVEVETVRRDVPLPAAATTATTLATLPWAAVVVVGWAALMVGVRVFDPPGSPWRSQLLLWGGTAAAAGVAVGMLVLARWRIRFERWSLTNRIVEHRRGVIVTRRTTVKRSHVSAAKFTQGPVERRLGLGSVTLLSRGLGNPDLAVPYLDADEARELAEMHRSTNTH